MKGLSRMCCIAPNSSTIYLQAQRQQAMQVTPGIHGLQHQAEIAQALFRYNGTGTALFCIIITQQAHGSPPPIINLIRDHG